MWAFYGPDMLSKENKLLSPVFKTLRTNLNRHPHSKKFNKIREKAFQIVRDHRQSWRIFCADEPGYDDGDHVLSIYSKYMFALYVYEH